VNSPVEIRGNSHGVRILSFMTNAENSKNLPPEDRGTWWPTGPQYNTNSGPAQLKTQKVYHQMGTGIKRPKREADR
jgi:hypothetical protein